MAARPSAAEIRLALTSGVRVNPSRIDTFPNVWIGAPKVGSRWTVEQFRKLEQDRDKAKATDSRLARAIVFKLRNLEAVEAWPVDLLSHVVECPLLARSRNGQRVLVITPGGEKLWINAR